MNSEEQIFSERVDSYPRWMVHLKRVLLLIVAVHLVIGIVSAYRAYFQIHSLEVTTDQVLKSGSVIKTNVVTYGRSFADVRLELVQNGKALKLYDLHVPANEFGFYDPRTQSGSFSVLITPQILEQFKVGSAVLRATAVGREQWTRLPPPAVREVNVTIQRTF